MGDDLFKGVEVGDTVRFTVEGEVTATSATRVYLDGGYIAAKRDSELLHDVQVTKPVKHFGPGTRIRHKRSGVDFIVGNDGIFCLEDNRWYPASESFADTLKSTYYEEIK